MSVQIDCDVTVRLRAPFLFPGLSLNGWGYDATALRDAQGHPLLPADQIKGVLRAALAGMLADAGKPLTALEAIFGQPGPDQANLRGALVFSDLRAEGLSAAGTPSTRVEIDDKTPDAPGTVREGHLVVTELVAPPGAEAQFVGKIYGHAETEAQAVEWITLLRAAATHISAIGSMKSAGFGEVVSVDLSRPKMVALSAAPVAPPAGRVAVALAFDRPFLVDAQRVADNVVASSETVPGGVIKGALAAALRALGHRPEEDADFSALSIAHAVPEGASRAVLPMSWVWLPDEARFADVLADPGLARGEKRFVTRPDWKTAQLEDAEKRRGVKRADLRLSDRAHVRIDPETGAAVDQALFFTTLVDPGQTRWLTEIDFGAIPASQQALYWGTLVAGLDRLGSTGARATVQVLGEAPAPAPVVTGDWLVVLETEAVLGDPAEGPPAEVYGAYWRDVAGAEMTGFMAAQDLRGDYLGMRGAGVYRPHFVTLPGSAFRLRVTDPARLAELVRRGLPPRLGKTRPGWRDCPFQPENGWGRISIEKVGA
ncbi:RAMP superfamily CRISPR-associated protein [Rhodobacter capsulatus]|uniref:RAMP superfamily CRISPR-associated protein n=1 Tax=Rhodobacter capsulatus TaxID=1061 RepID=UPI004026A1E4